MAVKKLRKGSGFVIYLRHILMAVNLQQLKGIESFKLGIWEEYPYCQWKINKRGAFFVKKGMQKVTLYKKLDVGTEPPCIFKDFFVLNRVRVSNPQRLTYTQILVKYMCTPPPGGPPHIFSVIFLDADQQGQQNIEHWQILVVLIVPQGCSSLLARGLKFIIIIIIIHLCLPGGRICTKRR